MATISQQSERKGLGFAFFAGPALWAAQVLVGYVLANLAGLGFSKIWYYILSALVLVIILAAGIVAWSSWRGLTHRERPAVKGYGEPVSRAEFVAASGVFLSSLFFFLTLLTGVFAIFMSPARFITMPFP